MSHSRIRSTTLNTARSCLGIAVLLGLFNFPADCHGQGQDETIATEGDAAPDGNGTYSSFSRMLLNDSGEISFQSFLTGTSGGVADDSGLYFRTAGGALGQIAREGQTVSGSNGTYNSLSSFGLNESGQVLFRSSIAGTSGGFSDDSGLFRSTGAGSLIVVAREGDTEPGGNGELSAFPNTNTNVGFSNSGLTSFRNTLLNTSGGANDNEAVFRSTNGPTKIVREGDAAPGGGNFSSFGTFVKVNDSGAVAFLGNVGANNGVYRADSTTTYVPIYVEGEAAPDGNGTMSFATGFMTMNNAGQVAFEAQMTGTANGSLDMEGVFRGDGNSVVQIAREGNNAGGDGEFNGVQSTTVRINQSGQVAFSSGLRNTSAGASNDSGIYRSSTSGFSLTEIAREGDAVSTGDGFLNTLAFAETGFNDRGHVAFRASLTGTSNNSGIFIGDGQELITVAQRGQSVDGSTISFIEFNGGEHFSSGLNNHGQVAYEANLVNGISVVKLWTPDVHWRRGFSSSWSSDNNWTLGIEPDSLYDTFIDPDSSLTVSGNVNATVRSLQVGGGTGQATLNMINGNTITATNGVTIESTGIVTGNGTLVGNVNNMGTIRANNVVFNGPLTNNGIIRGNGRVDADIVNTSAGEIRVGGNEFLQLTGGSLNNSGRVEVLGGELEVSAHVQNNASSGFITGRDAIMRFNGGITNEGAMGYSFGTSDVFGDINNSSGTISIGGGANVTFYDDIVQNGNFEVVASGTRISSAVVFGDFSGAGGFTGGGDVFLLGDLRPGNSPNSVLMDGNLFFGAATHSTFELEGLAIGEFDQLVVTGDLSLDGGLDVELLDGYLLGLNQQYVIADVAGSLFGEFDSFSEGALVDRFNGIDLFITYSGGDGNNIILFTPVPEPAAGLVGLIVIGGLFVRRRRDLL